MTRIASILLSFISCFSANGQNLHTPAEVQQYAEQLGLKLVHVPSSKTPDFKWPIITSTFMRVSTEDSTYLQPVSLETQDSSQNYHEKADYFLKEGEVGKALSVLRKLIDLSPMDIDAHRKMAAAYLLVDEAAKALRPITIAHLLNRNDPALLNMLAEVYRANGLDYEDWSLKPDYSLSAKGNTVTIAVAEIPWRAYADCMALWEYGENYATYMSNLSNVAVATIREKECLLNAVLAYEQMENGKEAFPELQSLADAISKGLVDEYILYEVSARYEPLQMRLLPTEKLELLVDYVLQHRAKPTIAR